MIMEEIEDKSIKQEQTKSSSLGIASFIISIVSAAIFSISVLTSISLDQFFPEKEYFLICFALMLLNFGISITGLAIGIIGVLLRDYKKLAAIGGTIINLWIIIMILLNFFAIAGKYPDSLIRLYR